MMDLGATYETSGLDPNYLIVFNLAAGQSLYIGTSHQKAIERSFLNLGV